MVEYGRRDVLAMAHGRPDDPARDALRLHVKMCAERVRKCREELAAAERLVAEAREQLREYDLPPTFHEAMHRINELMTARLQRRREMTPPKKNH